MHLPVESISQWFSLIVLLDFLLLGWFVSDIETDAIVAIGPWTQLGLFLRLHSVEIFIFDSSHLKQFLSFLHFLSLALLHGFALDVLRIFKIFLLVIFLKIALALQLLLQIKSELLLLLPVKLFLHFLLSLELLGLLIVYYGPLLFLWLNEASGLSAGDGQAHRRCFGRDEYLGLHNNKIKYSIATWF